MDLPGRHFSRRDFLKLLLLLPLLKVKLPTSATGLVPAPQGRTSPEGEGPLTNPPNILILVLDAFSAENASLYGYRRHTTPNLERFAQRATVFHQHYAGGNFTTPGTSSLFTGAYPWSHRGLHLFGTVLDKFADQNLFSLFWQDYFTMAFSHNLIVMNLLHQFSQYLDQFTLAKDLALESETVFDRIFPEDFNDSFWGERLVRGSGLPLPSSLFLSFAEGNFQEQPSENLKERYKDVFPRGLPYNTVGVFFLLEEAMDWIKSQVLSAPKPFVGYFHLFPPHEPYNTRKEFVDIFKDGWTPQPKPKHAFPQGRSESFLNNKRRYYDEFIPYADAEFGRLVDALEESGIMENTYFILTSDHGELFERGIQGHVTSTLYEPVIRTPLLISRPGQRERVDVDTRTSCVDLLPTLLHITGKPIPEWCEGQILPTFGDSKPDSERSIYVVEAKQNPKMGPLKIGTVALMKGDFKLIHYFGFKDFSDVYELYDLKKDPEEMENLYNKRTDLAAEMKSELLSKVEEENHKFEG
jgi:arylsulfatase A-like enzyme